MCKYNEAHELIHTPINISCTTAFFCIKFYFFTSTVLLVSSFSFRMFVCSFFFFSVFKVKALREKVFFAITKNWYFRWKASKSIFRTCAIHCTSILKEASGYIWRWGSTFNSKPTLVNHIFISLCTLISYPVYQTMIYIKLFTPLPFI